MCTNSWVSSRIARASTRPAARGLTKLIGREAELEQLRETLSRAAAGHGHFAAIVGEPGVGKSRLVWEVAHSHRTHGWLILQARSVSYGQATPYLLVIDLLRDYFQIEDQNDQRSVREKVTGKLLMLDEALKPMLPPPCSPFWTWRPRIPSGRRWTRPGVDSRPAMPSSACSCGRARSSRSSWSLKTSTDRLGHRRQQHPRRSSMRSWRSCPPLGSCSC